MRSRRPGTPSANRSTRPVQATGAIRFAGALRTITGRAPGCQAQRVMPLPRPDMVRPVTTALFRLELPDGRVGWARGAPDGGPAELLDPGLRLDAMLAEQGALERACAGPAAAEVPEGARVLAPVESQEVWAAGVTYLRSRDARGEESLDR